LNLTGNYLVAKYRVKMTDSEFLCLINSNQATINYLLNLYVQDKIEKEDLKQEIIYQAWKGKDKFLQKSSFNTWLYKVCLYTILTFKRKNEKFIKINLENADLNNNSEELNNDNAEQLYQYIRGLNPLNKTIITMHLDGFTNQEIAEFIGIKTNNLKVKLHRIKENIKLNLK